MKQTLELIDQLVVMAQDQDEKLKALNHQIHKSVQTIGESTIVFHLKALKELVIKESNPLGNFDLRDGVVYIAGKSLSYSFPNIIVGSGRCNCGEIVFGTPGDTCPKCGLKVNNIM